MRRRIPDRDNEIRECTDTAFNCAAQAAAADIREQFTVRGCISCHVVEEHDVDDTYARYPVHPVRLAQDFFAAGRFDHYSHQVMKDATGDAACLECHSADSSQASTDLLIPTSTTAWDATATPRLRIAYNSAVSLATRTTRTTVATPARLKRNHYEQEPVTESGLNNIRGSAIFLAGCSGGSPAASDAGTDAGNDCDGSCAATADTLQIADVEQVIAQRSAKRRHRASTRRLRWSTGLATYWRYTVWAIRPDGPSKCRPRLMTPPLRPSPPDSRASACRLLRCR